MLDANLKTQLRAYLERLVHDVELIGSLDASPAAAEMRTLLEEIAELSPRVSVRFDGQAARRPSFQISRAGSDMGVGFAAYVDPNDVDATLRVAKDAGYDAWVGGTVEKRGPRKAVEIEPLGITFEGETLQVR